MLFSIGYLLLPVGLACGVLWLLFRKRTPTRWLAVCFFIPPLLILAAVLPSPLPRSPKQVYQDIFGQPPGPGITGVHAATYYSTIAESAFLELKLSPEAARNLLREVQWNRDSSRFTREDAPSWWKGDTLPWGSLPSHRFSEIRVFRAPGSETLYLYAFTLEFD